MAQKKKLTYSSYKKLPLPLKTQSVKITEISDASHFKHVKIINMAVQSVIKGTIRFGEMLISYCTILQNVTTAKKKTIFSGAIVSHKKMPLVHQGLKDPDLRKLSIHNTTADFFP